MRPTLDVRELEVHFPTSGGPVKAVDGVSFALQPGERLGLIGESGSGKSTIALAVMRLIKPPGEIVGGEILLDGVDLLSLSEDEMRRRRLAEIALVTQGAMNSLNPVTRIGRQIEDAIQAHDEGSVQGSTQGPRGPSYSKLSTSNPKSPTSFRTSSAAV